MAESIFSYERLRRHARAITTAWIGYWAILVCLTHSPKLPRVPIHLTKRGTIAHYTAYFLLAAGCYLSRRARVGYTGLRWAVTWMSIFAVVAALDEILQPLTHRDADITDWLADVAGVITLMLIVRPWSRANSPGTLNLETTGGAR